MLERHWYRLTPLSLLLLPLSLIFCGLVQLRRSLYRMGLLPSTHISVPVIVVGNISVGGTGKTPLTIWLANYLRLAGYDPGVVTRGYRGKSDSWPVEISTQSTTDQVGDEAVLLARHAGCPVIAGPDRVAAAQRHATLGRNVIISDDGLQHYRLHRDIEIAVIDGLRRFGNGLCLPAGPLREPVSRLKSVFMQITNGAPHAGELGVILAPTGIYNLTQPNSRKPAEQFQDGPVHAVAGIGNPERFFAALRGMGLDIIAHPFPDHHDYRPDELAFDDDRPIIMTEKDAVKCQAFASPRFWALAVEARPDAALGEQILQRLKEILRGQQAA